MGTICDTLVDVAISAVVESRAVFEPIVDMSVRNPVEIMTAIANMTAVVTARMRTTRLKTQKRAPQSAQWYGD